MGKRALVTGSTGFLGLNLISELKRNGWDVTALYLPGSDLSYLDRLSVRKAPADITVEASLEGVFPSAVDAVFHVAGNTSAWAKGNERQYRDNVIGTKNMAKVAIDKGARIFVYTSSISAFGYHPGVLVDEETASNAMRCGMNYNRTKFLAEQEVKKAFAAGPRAVILNPCNILGPHDTNNWTRQFILPIYQSKLRAAPPGRAMWCHVRDVAAAHISAAERGRAGHNYLLGGVEASFKEIVNEIEAMMGRPRTERVFSKAVMRAGVVAGALKSFIDGKEPLLTPEKYNRAVASIRCDFRKAREELGYSAAPISEIIRDTYEWLCKEGFLIPEASNAR
ncbi:MAG: NAD-dependent epimerase/dehydratase family protein [bacterium]